MKKARLWCDFDGRSVVVVAFFPQENGRRLQIFLAARFWEREGGVCFGGNEEFFHRVRVWWCSGSLASGRMRNWALGFRGGNWRPLSGSNHHFAECHCYCGFGCRRYLNTVATFFLGGGGSLFWLPAVPGT